ncbi:hypothetical protein EPI10_007684 [Gossypium australe]|uniref:CCHC-type domain-containing protein n=1 Tax=Gossypium australe TaxID=47621 RepID=A0A5B6V2A8_9ROSI|nr:hypothetical protein EPI10_007684 [Gossypium australe]
MLDAEIHLDAKCLGEIINEENEISSQDNAKAEIFLCHHLHEGPKTEYLTGKDPLVLWNSLKERYDHQETNITDEDLLEKHTPHFTQIMLSCRHNIVKKQNNELTKNHESHPTDSTPFLEANVTSYSGKEKGHASGRGQGHGPDHGHGRRHGRGVKCLCYRCGDKNHWSRTCCTPKHVVELYQQSLKDKGEKIETNFVCENDEDDYGIVDTTHLEAVDFFTTPNGNN